MGTIFETRLLLDHSQGPNGLTGWWDGGRAAVESDEIVQDIKEFQDLLAEIELAGHEISDFNEVPEIIQERMLEKIDEMQKAIEAMPHKEESFKQKLREKLINVVGKKYDGVGALEHIRSYYDLAKIFNSELTSMVEKYKNEYALKNGKIKNYTGELAALGTVIRYYSTKQLIEVANSYQLNNAEIRQLVIDFELGKGGFTSMHQILNIKFAFQHYGIKFHQILKANLQANAMFLAKNLGFTYIHQSRNLHPKHRFDVDGYREPHRTEIIGEPLEPSERISRLRTVLGKMKL